MGIFQKNKVKRLQRKAIKANRLAEKTGQSARDAIIRTDELVAEFKEIDSDLKLIPWFRPFKRLSTRRHLEKVRVLLRPAQEDADLKYELADETKVLASEIELSAETERIYQQLTNNLNDVGSISKWLLDPPKIYYAKDLRKNKQLIPKAKGIYAWYFVRGELDVPNNSYFSVDGFELLYVGIAGKKPEGKGNLRSRIGSQHITGNAEGSSLRFNLGILLRRKGHPLVLKRKGLKRIEWSDENYLTDWICNNAVVAWLEHKRPDIVERLAVESYGHLLPLNYEHNENNIFSQNLKNERSEMRSQVPLKGRQRVSMKKHVLISCVSQKLDHSAKAKDLYTSPLFRMGYRYAKSLKPNNVFVLSAKHGLISSSKVIEPYNVTLNDMKAVDVKEWSEGVLAQLRRHTDLERDLFVFLAGEKYRKYLLPHIENYQIPMEGLGIGEQLSWLKRRTEI